MEGLAGPGAVQHPHHHHHEAALPVPDHHMQQCQQQQGRACNKRTSLQMDSSEHWTAAESVSTSGSTSLSLGSPSDATPKRHMAHRHQQHAHEAAPPQFPVLDYHMQQCQQHQGTFLNNTLQPADSSTWSNWNQVQLPTWEQLQLLNQADQHMADSQLQSPVAAGAAQAPQHSQPQLQRANSAPELVKLTQADSAAWQQAHATSAAGGGNPAPSALLSHRDYWVI